MANSSVQAARTSARGSIFTGFAATLSSRQVWRGSAATAAHTAGPDGMRPRWSMPYRSSEMAGMFHMRRRARGCRGSETTQIGG
jgi:hypothetical protein